MRFLTWEVHQKVGVVCHQNIREDAGVDIAMNALHLGGAAEDGWGVSRKRLSRDPEWV